MLEDEALLVRRVAWRESSWVVHLFTRAHGRIALVAKGARRLKSPFRGHLEPLHRLHIRWRPGRIGMGVLAAAERHEALLPEARWPEGLAITAAAAMLFPEGTEEGFAALEAALFTCAKAQAPSAYVAGLWTLCSKAGIAAAADACWRCGARHDLVLAEHGLACTRCGTGPSWPEAASRALAGQTAEAKAVELALALLASIFAAQNLRLPKLGG